MSDSTQKISGQNELNEKPRMQLSETQAGAVISLDDGKANAFDRVWFEQFNELLDQVEQSNVKSVAILGRPGIFSGGLNIKWLPTLSNDEMKSFLSLFASSMERLYRFPKPTLAVLTGHAVAGGCILACACDRRIALSATGDKDFNFWMNEVLLGMELPHWIYKIVASAIPSPMVYDVLTLAQPLPFKQAQNLGVLFNQYASEDLLKQALHEQLQAFNQLNRACFFATKQIFRQKNE